METTAATRPDDPQLVTPFDCLSPQSQRITEARLLCALYYQKLISQAEIDSILWQLSDSELDAVLSFDYEADDLPISVPGRDCLPKDNITQNSG